MAERVRTAEEVLGAIHSRLNEITRELNMQYTDGEKAVSDEVPRETLERESERSRLNEAMVMQQGIVDEEEEAQEQGRAPRTVPTAGACTNCFTNNAQCRINPENEQTSKCGRCNYLDVACSLEG